MPNHTCTAMLHGTGLIAAIVMTATYSCRIFSLDQYGISTLSLSLLLGITLSNICSLPGSIQPAIHFSQQKLLRGGVILFGLHISIQQLLHVGAEAVAIDLIVMATLLIGGTWLGISVFGLKRDLAVMIASGSAICGAAAVIATEPVVRGESAHTSMAVASVVIFGSLAMLIYPLLYHLTGATPESFAIYTGSTVHEVAQVIAIGHGVDDNAAQTAVIVKMIRVMLLAPALLLISIWWHRNGHADKNNASPSPIPLFAVGFIAVVIINSIWTMPETLHRNLSMTGSQMLAAGMAALGLGTDIGQLKSLGTQPLWFAATLFFLLMAGGAMLTLI
ncbi:YeiH family putative sulfate export transporter [Mariprofundus erugo]|uniref:YeiH family putative sulfate export transporter n=1 Tax=Mariprofundus erugo TaxID=2528639 RepID=A0A5R9GU99_9PROT|nr:YeiH family protein [Mariprofundus erugo]TLS66774.1 YeiH family putative sulfate export transporter [Mariprofundus erugo]